MRALDGKVCVVTGAARGIGKAISEELLSRGATVVLADVSKDGFDSWLPQAGYGVNAVPLVLDVTSSSSVRSGLQGVKRELGRIDVLINNAGVERSELIGAISEESMHRMFEVNAYGTILMTQYASRIMRQRKTKGSIINIASGVGIHGNPGQSVYAATKGAVISFTKAAAKELGPTGIRVNAVAPGLTDTGMLKDTSEELIAQRLGRIPLGRIAEPTDIACAVAFLASDDASYVSGQVLAVDGCQIM